MNEQDEDNTFSGVEMAAVVEGKTPPTSTTS
jgi:hypothetical protein